MTNFILYYIGIGFTINTALALWNFYTRYEEGYIILPHPFVYFLTIFSWPKTLWDLIASFNDKDDKDES